MAPDLASLLRWAPALPHVLWFRTSPPGWGGLWHCHVSRGSGPHLPVEVGSGAVTCPMAPDLTSQSRWALALPHVLRLRTSPPDWGEFWCCHVSYGSGPLLPAEVGSDAAMCHMALDLTSRLRRARTLPCVLWHRTSPPNWDGIRHGHVSHGYLWAAGLKHKEKPSSPACAARYACSQHLRSCLQGAWQQGRHGSARRVGRQLLAVLKPSRIICKHTDANYSSFWDYLEG
jgi:hypothetical protein